jgi:hypothetical protein
MQTPATCPVHLTDLRGRQQLHVDILTSGTLTRRAHTAHPPRVGMEAILTLCEAIGG